MDYNFRTLNYLGSKLRLLDFIEGQIKTITPVGTGVCDLFAGSGCVARRLSRDFKVTACDIQHYSEIICKALLVKSNITDREISDFIAALDSENTKGLKNAFAPLIKLENDAICNHDIDLLASILEHGSVEVFNIEHDMSSLHDKLFEVNENLATGNMNGNVSIASRYYGGVYFSYQQAVDIDCILEAIHLTVPQEKKSTFIAALLSTASDIVDTVGKHFAQPIKARDSKGNIKKSIYNKAVKDKTINTVERYLDWLRRYKDLSVTDGHNVLRANYEQCLVNLPQSVKTIYADPPYTRDHYSRYYHVLETLTLRDAPELSTVTIHGATHVSGGIYRNDRHQSPFCIKSKAPSAFRRLFELTSSTGRNLLLSYSPYDESKGSHPRVVTMSQLVELANSYFANVDVISGGNFRHNKLNSTEHLLDASEEAEVVIVCTNNKSI